VVVIFNNSGPERTVPVQGSSSVRTKYLTNAASGYSTGVAVTVIFVISSVVMKALSTVKTEKDTIWGVVGSGETKIGTDPTEYSTVY
jgi:hypothetical protein